MKKLIPFICSGMLTLICFCSYGQSSQDSLPAQASFQQALNQNLDQTENERLQDENIILAQQLSSKDAEIERLKATSAEQELIIAKDTPLIYEQARTIEGQQEVIKKQNRAIHAGSLLASIVIIFLIANH